MKLNLKNKYLLLRAKIFFYLWTKRMGKDVFLKKWEYYYYTYIMALVCHFKSHLWDIKVEWSGKKVGKYRTCTRCRKAEKYQSIFSTKLA